MTNRRIDLQMGATYDPCQERALVVMVTRLPSVRSAALVSLLLQTHVM